MQPTEQLFKPAINTAETWWTSLASSRSSGPASILDTEASSGRFQQSVYELFSEMEEKDGHLYSVIQTRIHALLGLPISFKSSEESDAAHEVTTVVERAIRSIPRFQDFLRALLDSLAKGVSVVELLWGYDSKGHIVPVDWLSHPQEFFLLDQRGQLLLLSPPFHATTGSEEIQQSALVQNSANIGRAERLVSPVPHKFIATLYGQDARNPYGRGLCQRAYWYYWFKKNTLKFWSIYNEKFGAPTAVATYQAGTSEEQRQQLLEILDSLQTDAGVVVPESVRIELLSGAASGDGECFRSLADWCNDEMSKIVLGATLTSGEGRRSGSLSLGKVHADVRQEYLEADAKRLENVLNDTLVRWIAELNFTRPAIPKLTFNATKPADLEVEARIDEQLIKLGVPLPLSYFYKTYGRPEPRESDAQLSFDDSNLFQYHLQHGILTVNEVRERLRLPKVAWGEQRTQLTTSQSSGSGASSEELRGGEASDERLESGQEERNQD